MDFRSIKNLFSGQGNGHHHKMGDADPSYGVWIALLVETKVSLFYWKENPGGLAFLRNGWVCGRGCENFPGRGHGNPFPHSCLENPMDRGAWWAIVQRVTKSRTLLSMYTHTKIRRDILLTVTISIAGHINYSSSSVIIPLHMLFTQRLNYNLHQLLYEIKWKG